jgi:hypothetical protein
MASRIFRRGRVLIACYIAFALAGMAGAQSTARKYSFIPVLHSVSYAGVWRGQTQLSPGQFLIKAKELGFSNVEVMARRPQLLPLD